MQAGTFGLASEAYCTWPSFAVAEIERFSCRVVRLARVLETRARDRGARLLEDRLGDTETARQLVLAGEGVGAAALVGADRPLPLPALREVGLDQEFRLGLGQLGLHRARAARPGEAPRPDGHDHEPDQQGAQAGTHGPDAQASLSVVGIFPSAFPALGGPHQIHRAGCRFTEADGTQQPAKTAPGRASPPTGCLRPSGPLLWHSQPESANRNVPRRPSTMPKLQPLDDRIVVRPRPSPRRTTASGLVIPDTAKEKPQQGEVIAVGPGRRSEDTGELSPRRQGGRHRRLLQVRRYGVRAGRRGRADPVGPRHPGQAGLIGRIRIRIRSARRPGSPAGAAATDQIPLTRSPARAREEKSCPRS